MLINYCVMIQIVYICANKQKKGIMQEESEKDKLYRVIRYAVVILLVVFVLLPLLLGVVSTFLSD